MLFPIGGTRVIIRGLTYTVREARAAEYPCLSGGHQLSKLHSVFMIYINEGSGRLPGP